MSKLTTTVTDLVRGVWRQRRAGIAALWAVGVLALGAALLMPPQYEATARVYVNTSTALKPLLEGLAVDQDVDAQLGLIREELLGRPRLERVIKDADLALGARTPDDMDRLIAMLQKAIVIEAKTPGTRRDSNRSGDAVYSISYRHATRDKALTVVRSLLDAFMEDTMSGKRAGADSAQEFLRKQIRDYEQRLSEAETRLSDFKKRNVGLVPGEQGDYFSRLQAAAAAAKAAESALQVAVQRRAELARQLSGESPYRAAGGQLAASDPSSGSGAGVLGTDTVSRVAETQAKIEELRLRFTDRHPDVIALQETLAKLKERHASELEAVKRGDSTVAATAGLSTNPLYQSIQLQLNQVNVEIAALRGQIADNRSTEAELRRMVNTAPEVEAEFARLTRDYGVEKAQYTALLERLEKAKLSESAADTGIVEFRVINPPTADPSPVTPARKLLVAAAFLFSLAAAVAVAFLLSRLRPVFDSTRVLAEETGLPVLGAVPITWRERTAEQFRLGLWQVGGAVAGLAALYAAALFAYRPAAQLVGQIHGT